MKAPDDAIVISHHDTVGEAQGAGHELIRQLCGLPSGWALAIFGDDENGYDLVRREL